MIRVVVPLTGAESLLETVQLLGLAQVHVGYATDIASRVIELSQSVDSEAVLDRCEYGVDVAGTGGHSYGIRLAVCNDCVATGYGSALRHVVDLAGASRNTVYGAGNRSYSADFLTHGNACRGNRFVNIGSAGVRTSGAVSFDPANGDVDNVVEGGTVDGMPIYRAQKGLNTIKNMTIRLRDRYGFPHPGHQILENCTIISEYGMMYPVTRQADLENGGTDAILELRGCTVTINVIRGLLTSAASTNNMTLRLINCVLEINSGVQAVDSGVNSRLQMIGGRILLSGEHGITATLNVRGSGFLRGVTVDSQHANTKHLIGVYASTQFAIDRCTFTAAHPAFEVFKPIELNPKIIIGQCTYSAGAVPLGGYANRKLASIGVPVLPNGGLATSGTWDEGSQFALPAPLAGGVTGWTRSGNAWWPTGLVSNSQVNAAGDSNVTLGVGQARGTTTRYAAQITGNRTVTLSNANAYNGAQARVIRTAAATGAFDVSVIPEGGAAIKTLAPGTWATFVHDGVSWGSSGGGSL